MTDILTHGILRTPHVSGAEITDPNSFDVAPIIRGPVIRGALLADPTVVVPDIIARLYELPNLTDPIVSDLTLSRSRSWVDVLNDPGHGELHFPLDDPNLADIQIGHIHVIGMEYKGWRAFDLICEKKHTVTLAEAEEVAEEAVITGPGIFGATMWGEVYPALGVLREPIEENRAFNWTGFGYPDSGWAHAKAVCTVGYAQTTGVSGVGWNYNSPAFLISPLFGEPLGAFTCWDPDFADTSAAILWASNGAVIGAITPGDVYSRQIVNIGAQGTYQISLLADNAAELYLDGARLMSVGTGSGDGHRSTGKTTLILSAGEHLIAIKATNFDHGAAVNAYNPAGWAFAIHPSDENGVLGPLAAHSDTTAKILAYTTPPGMSVGLVLNIVLDEFLHRGGLPDLVRSWTNDVDTNGEPWPIVGDIATRVGTKIGVFLRELADTYLDLRWSAGTMTLDAFVKDGLGISRPVTFHGPTDPDDPESSNLLHLEQDLDATESADVILAKADFGWTERVRDPSPTSYGRIENTFGLGAQQSLTEVNRILDGQLDLYQDPLEQITAAVRAALAEDDAYFGYEVGDTIAGVPDSAGDVLAQRVISIAVTEDNDTGVATAVPTFKGIVYAAEERFSIDMAKTSGYTAGGSSRVAQPWTPEGKIKTIPQAHTGWDEFIRGADPWFWWRLSEGTIAADQLVAKDRQNRLDARYRVCQDDGSPPVDDPLGEFFGAAPADPPFLVTGRPGLVSNNPNKAARFRDSGAWAETPYTNLPDIFDAQGYYPWFPNFTALCLFWVESVGPSFAVLDFFAKLTPTSLATVWRAGIYGDALPLTLFAETNGGGSYGEQAAAVGAGKHLLVITHEITVVGYDAATFRWRGDWSTSTLYLAGDVVNTITAPMFTGSPPGAVYVADADNSGANPDDGAPWTAITVDTSTVTVYLDDVMLFTIGGLGSFAQPDVFRVFTSMEPGNGIGAAPDLSIIGDEAVIWSRVLSAAERAKALDLSGV